MFRRRNEPDPLDAEPNARWPAYLLAEASFERKIMAEPILLIFHKGVLPPT
jgi:hypothetical protein